MFNVVLFSNLHALRLTVLVVICVFSDCAIWIWGCFLLCRFVLLHTVNVN